VGKLLGAVTPAVEGSARWASDSPRLSTQVDGRDPSHGADIGHGITIDYEQVSVEAGGHPALAVTDATGHGRQ
jgi:hypothetical protein